METVPISLHEVTITMIPKPERHYKIENYRLKYLMNTHQKDLELNQQTKFKNIKKDPTP